MRESSNTPNPDFGRKKSSPEMSHHKVSMEEQLLVDSMLATMVMFEHEQNEKKQKQKQRERMGSSSSFVSSTGGKRSSSSRKNSSGSNASHNPSRKDSATSTTSSVLMKRRTSRTVSLGSTLGLLNEIREEIGEEEEIATGGEEEDGEAQGWVIESSDSSGGDGILGILGMVRHQMIATMIKHRFHYLLYAFSIALCLLPMIFLMRESLVWYWESLYANGFNKDSIEGTRASGWDRMWIQGYDTILFSTFTTIVSPIGMLLGSFFFVFAKDSRYDLKTVLSNEKHRLVLVALFAASAQLQTAVVQFFFGFMPMITNLSTLGRFLAAPLISIFLGRILTKYLPFKWLTPTTAKSMLARSKRGERGMEGW
eukprot:TRINITY_DN1929_c0_g2_i1.p1 TRINITY_DN1929_c0_g2~~TRINITY_DN1929_c0_g2_i1.p1  ORF type:complete len:368 (+),score=80.67 TRINITY_DN1929_c0_g2_i1:50-1153(+)